MRGALQRGAKNRKTASSFLKGRLLTSENLRGQRVELALVPNLPPALLHLLPELVDELRDPLRALLLLRVLDPLVPDVAVPGVDEADVLAGRRRLLGLQVLGVEPVHGHPEVVRVVVVEHREAVPPLGLLEVRPELDGGVEEQERRSRLQILLLLLRLLILLVVVERLRRRRRRGIVIRRGTAHGRRDASAPAAVLLVVVVVGLSRVGLGCQDGPHHVIRRRTVAHHHHHLLLLFLLLSSTAAAIARVVLLLLDEQRQGRAGGHGVHRQGEQRRVEVRDATAIDGHTSGVVVVVVVMIPHRRRGRRLVGRALGRSLDRQRMELRRRLRVVAEGDVTLLLLLLMVLVIVVAVAGDVLMMVVVMVLVMLVRHTGPSPAAAAPGSAGRVCRVDRRVGRNGRRGNNSGGICYAGTGGAILDSSSCRRCCHRVVLTVVVVVVDGIVVVAVAIIVAVRRRRVHRVPAVPGDVVVVAAPGRQPVEPVMLDGHVAVAVAAAPLLAGGAVAAALPAALVIAATFSVAVAAAAVVPLFEVLGPVGGVLPAIEERRIEVRVQRQLHPLHLVRDVMFAEEKSCFTIPFFLFCCYIGWGCVFTLTQIGDDR